MSPALGPVPIPVCSASSTSIETSATATPELPLPLVPMGTRRLRIDRPVCAACCSKSPSDVDAGKMSIIDWPMSSGPLVAQKFFHRAGSHHQPPVAAEHQNGVLQIVQQPLEIAAEIGKVVLRAAQLLAEQIHLRRHHARIRRRTISGPASVS